MGVRMKKSVFSIGVLALAVAGCSSAPEPVESDVRSYLPALTTYVSGVWEVDNQLAHLPFFFSQSSNDEIESTFNPGGFLALRGVVPEDLKLIVFPAHAVQERFENWEPQHAIVDGYVLARVVVDGVSKDFIREYRLKCYDQGKVELKIFTTGYALQVGPEPSTMKLVPAELASEREPELVLRRVDTLPGRDGHLLSLNGQAITYDRSSLPPGVQVAK